MIDLQEELKKFEFQKKGIITLSKDKKHPIFELFNSLETLEGNVYLWVTEINNNPPEVLYIGKAGGKISKRYREWAGGFKGGSKRGKEVSSKLLNLLKEQVNISIYVRHSRTTTILEQDNISLCEAEEKALIERYKGKYTLLNRVYPLIKIKGFVK